MIRVLIVGVLFQQSLCQVTVITDRGRVVGNYGHGDTLMTFFGVPYARVDENNPFGESRPFPKFKVPFNANNSTIRCPQVLFRPGGTLQCLTLNIYVPQRISPIDVLPVFVWFHGGGFVFGNSGEYDGKFLARHDIIVVTVNYRLGPYGFMCLDHPSVPGNQGLKDQIAALRWIKENIHSFGGNPNQVTIGGESYGGGGVELHLYTDYEKLFNKAIIQSGSVMAQGFYTKPDYSTAKRLAKRLGHEVRTTDEALAFLAREEPLKVMEASRSLALKLTVCQEKTFKDVANFLATNPYNLWNPDRLKDFPVLIGYNSKEDFGTFVNRSSKFYQKLGNVFYKKLNNNFVFTDHELEVYSDIVRRFYLGGKRISRESYIELSDFSSDFILNWPTEWSVNNLVKQGARVFKYMFSYIGGSQYRNEKGAGAIHTEELKYLFEFHTKLTADEQLGVMDKMTMLWANFVKFGNPTPSLPELPVGSNLLELLPLIWHPIPLNKTDRPYLNIDSDWTMMNHAFHDRMAFWELFYRSFYKKTVLMQDEESSS